MSEVRISTEGAVVNLQGDRAVIFIRLFFGVSVVAHVGSAISIFHVGMLTVLPEVSAWLVQVVTYSSTGAVVGGRCAWPCLTP